MNAETLLVARYIAVIGAPRTEADVPTARDVARFAWDQFNLVISESLAIKARSSLSSVVS
jgi:hypothetical protein